jgi:MOSC domain-containing protein YiiM
MFAAPFHFEGLSMLPSVSPVILCGKVEPLGTRGQLSGIAKTRVRGPWRITSLGLVGDAQADLKNHGGPEKAIHHYALDHYQDWRKEIGMQPLLEGPGAFGENVSTTLWTEKTVHIGDIVRFGSALLQVSQGRQPCWKLNVRFGRGDIAHQVQATGRTGWYYRVLEEGSADSDCQLELVERPHAQWPLSRLIALLYQDKERYAELEEMAAIAELAPSWRRLAARRVQARTTEDWTPRIQEPR